MRVMQMGGVGYQLNGYLNNFNTGFEQMQQLQNQAQLGSLQQQLGQLMQQQAMFGMQLQRDQYGNMFLPQAMPQLMPMGGMMPMGGINPMSQMGGFPPPNQILQAGGVTQGLSSVAGTGSPAFPAGATKTAGGYVVVPDNGDRGFTVYKPGSNGTSKDNIAFTCKGDPHVYDKNGHEIFMFTQNCDFQLPDGTTLGVDTTRQKGASYVNSMDIINGNSHVKATYNGNNVSVGPDQNDGVHTLAERYASTNWSQDTYALALDSNGNPSFYDFVRGQNEGKITGYSHGSDDVYRPTVDHNQTNYAVANQFKPQPGTAAYGNQLFMQALEIYSDPKYQGKLPEAQLAQVTSNWYQDLSQTMNKGQQPPMPGYCGSQWGGGVNPQMLNSFLPNCFGTLNNYAPINIYNMPQGIYR